MHTSHILVAEDDPDTRELIELVLRRAGFAAIDLRFGKNMLINTSI